MKRMVVFLVIIAFMTKSKGDVGLTENFYRSSCPGSNWRWRKWSQTSSRKHLWLHRAFFDCFSTIASWRDATEASSLSCPVMTLKKIIQSTCHYQSKHLRPLGSQGISGGHMSGHCKLRGQNCHSCQGCCGTGTQVFKTRPLPSDLYRWRWSTLSLLEQFPVRIGFTWNRTETPL